MRLPMRRLPPSPKKCYSKTMTLLLVPFMMLWIREHLSKSKILRELMRHGRNLEESFEGTQAVKGAKAYILKEKFTSFKMKDDESVPEMFHRLQVLINDLKALGEEVKDKDFSHKFLRCLPSRLVTILVRSDLDTMTPNQVLGDIMTDDTYRYDDEKEEKKEKKDEKKDEKKKSVAFKAPSSKGKAKQETSSEDDGS